MLFDSKEMWIGTNSNVIYKMKIQFSVSDLSESTGEIFKSILKDAGEDKITMTFTLKSFYREYHNTL